MVARLAILVSLALCSVVAWAQTGKVPIEIKHSGNDDVGRRFAYELKDALRGSNTFRLLEVAQSEARLVISVTSVGERDSVSAIAIATTVDAESIPVNGLYVTSQVLRLGALRTKEFAGTVISDIDESVTLLRTKWPSVYKLLMKAQ